MIRHPNINERHLTHSPAYWREELIQLRNLKDQVLEYGGFLQLLADIETLTTELEK